MLRNVIIAQHKFTNLPVYETGWTSKLSLYKSYRNMVNTEDQIERPTFMDVLNLLTLYAMIGNRNKY